MIYSKKNVLKLIDEHIETVKNVMACHKRMYENLGKSTDEDGCLRYLEGQLSALDRLRREIEPFKRVV